MAALPFGDILSFSSHKCNEKKYESRIDTKGFQNYNKYQIGAAFRQPLSKAAAQFRGIGSRLSHAAAYS